MVRYACCVIEVLCRLFWMTHKKSFIHSYLDGADRLQTYAFLVRFR